MNTPTLCRCLEVLKGPGDSMLDYLATHTSLSPIRGEFMPSFVNYKKGCTWLAAASDKVYQLFAHRRLFSPASSTTKTGRHDIAEILLKIALTLLGLLLEVNYPITTWPPRSNQVWYLILSLMSCIFQEHHCLFSC